MRYHFLVHNQSFNFSSDTDYEEFIISCAKLTECPDNHGLFVRRFSDAVYDMLCSVMLKINEVSIFNCYIMKSEDDWTLLNLTPITCRFNFDEKYVEFSGGLAQPILLFDESKKEIIRFKFNEETEKFDICNSEK